MRMLEVRWPVYGGKTTEISRQQLSTPLHLTCQHWRRQLWTLGHVPTRLPTINFVFSSLRSRPQSTTADYILVPYIKVYITIHLM